MKNLFTLVVVALFTLSLSANNAEIKRQKNYFVAVDCDGDGIADYTGTVSEEYVDALIAQFKASC
ncbi:MAG: hypothetical protein ACTIK4_03485 [Mesonia sp.]|uniref:hypothetical protein n=1 Tax=Mesonia sp. TaxID=1960830 RepID=UPI003F97E65C